MVKRMLKLAVKGIQNPKAALRRLLEKSWVFWERLGFHIVPNHFYYPIPDTSYLLQTKPWERDFPLEGIDMRDNDQLLLLETISEFSQEYRPGGSKFESNGDGSVLYGMIRKLRPETVIEVGAGASTRVIYSATKKNREDGCPRANIRTVEPHPDDELIDLAERSDTVNLIQSKAERLPVAFFQKLEEGDVLFIDSSHVLTPGNDVAHLFLRVLPKLSDGVYIHIHDIRFPEEYPRSWILNRHRFFAEQYLLQAFLAFNTEYEVVWAGNYMKLNYERRIRDLLPDYTGDDGWPGSFWIRRVV